MAIHIDIYAHLRKEQLIKEGEQLRRYVESLEKDANKRLERGAQGLSSKVIALNDKQARSYDGLINSHDAFIKSKRRRKEIEKQVIAVAKETLKVEQQIATLATQTRKTAQGQINLDKKRADAAEKLLKLEAQARDVKQELASAEDNLTYASQRYVAAANARTSAQKAAKQEEKAHLKLLRENATSFHQLSAATVKQRREVENLHKANIVAIKDNVSVAKGMDRVSDATKRTTKERKKYKDMVKEGVAGHRELLQQTNRVIAAHEAENKIIGEVTDNIKGLSRQHQLHRVVVDANRDSLKDYASTAVAAKKQIKDLSTTHAQVISGNAKLAKSFGNANAAIKAALKEHKEYNRLVRDGAGQDALRDKAERVADAYAKQRKEVDAATTSLGDLLKGQAQANAFVRTQRDTMRDYARSALDAKNQIENLHTVHQDQIRSSAALTRAFDNVGVATKKAISLHQDYNRLVSSGAGRDDLRKQAQKVSDAYAQQARDVDHATESLVRHRKEQSDKRIRGMTGGAGEYVSRNINALIPGGRLNMGVLVPLAGILGSVAEAAVTASQSLALLPALATSAAAAFGTLAIGTHGFFDALGDMADPKKWAEGLALLSPNAQQAAISIKELVDGPLGDLKAMVQDNLFAGVAGQLQALSGAFGPEMSDLFGGLATEMNKAFMGISNVLMAPDVQASLGTTIDNIVAGFRELMPMLGPLTQAFVTITEVGSSFLPGIGQTFTELATQFNAFIQTAAQDGSLQTFIQKGIEALGVLLGFIKDVGVEIYNVFGNKSPEEFRNTLETVKDVVFDIGWAIVGLAHIINTLMPVLDSVATAFGGWNQMMGVFVALWAGNKLKGPIMTVAKMLGAGGVLGGALNDLPKAGEKAGAGLGTGILKGLKSVFKIGLVLEIGKLVNDAVDDYLKNNHPDLYNLNYTNTPDVLGRKARSWIQGNGWNDPRAADVPHVGPDGKPDRGVPSDTDSPYSKPFRSGWNTAPGTTDWFGRPVPTHTDPKDFQSTPGTFELDKIPVGQFPGAQWNVPQGVTDLPPDYNNMGKTGFYHTDPMKIMQEQGDVDSALQDAQEKRIKYLATLADITHTQDDVNKANQDVINAEQTYLQSVRDLKEAERGEFEDLTSEMDAQSKDLKDALGSLGVALDPDLGISKGLAGLAENAVKFFATLGAAPMLGQLKAGQALLGYPNNKDNGSGLIGMLGPSMGYYNEPTSYKDQGNQARLDYGASRGLQTVTPNGPVAAGSPGNAGSDKGLVPGLASMNDIIANMFPLAGAIGGVRQDRLPYHPSGRAIDIPVDADQINGGKTPGSKSLGDRIWNWMQSTGVFDMEGGPGHRSSLWQEPSHYGHIHAQLKKEYEQTNFSGGLPGYAAEKVPDWDMIAAAESGTRGVPGSARWNLPGGDRDSTGGLQIRQGTWNDFGGQSIAPSPWQASKEDQIKIAEKILAKQGPEAWAGGKNFFWKDGAAALSGMPGTVPGSPLSAEAPSGSTVPVFVTNWPGGSGGFGAGGGGGAGTGGEGVGPGTGPSAAPSGPGGGGGSQSASPGGGGAGPGGAGPGLIGPGGGGTGPGAGGPGLIGPAGSGSSIFNPALGKGGPGSYTPGTNPLDVFAPTRTSDFGIDKATDLSSGKPKSFQQRAADWIQNLLGKSPPETVVGPNGELPPRTYSGGGGPFPKSLEHGGNEFIDALSAGGPNPGSVKPFTGSFAGAWNLPTDKSLIEPLMNGLTNRQGSPANAAPGLSPFGGPYPAANWQPSAIINSFATDTPPGGPAPSDWQLSHNMNDIPSALKNYTQQNPAAQSRPAAPTPTLRPQSVEGGSNPFKRWWDTQTLFPSLAGSFAREIGGAFAKGGEVPIIAHSGEHVLTTRDVSAMGGQQGVYNFRSALHYKGGGEVIDQLLGGVSGTTPPNSTGAPTAIPPAPKGPLIGPAGQGQGPKPPGPPPAIPPVAPPAAPPAVGPAHIPTGVPALPGPAPGDGNQTPVGVPTIGTPIGGQVDPDTGYGEGLNISGGIVGAAMNAAASAASMGMEGGGAAASAGMQIAIQEIQRGIEFGSQVAGIGVQGLMETFLPSGGSELANNNWVTRLVGGIVGAAPAIANVAGGAGKQLGQGAGLPGVGPPTPEQIAAQGLDPNRTQHTGTGPPPGPTNNTGVHIENYVTSDNRGSAQDLARTMAPYAMPGAR